MSRSVKNFLKDADIILGEEVFPHLYHVPVGNPATDEWCAIDIRNLIEASIENSSILINANDLIGTELASNVVVSSLTEVGTLVAGSTGLGFTLNFTLSTISGILPVANLPALTGAIVTSEGSDTTTQVIDSDVYMQSPSDGTFTLKAKSSFAFIINQIRGLATSSGTCTLTISINGTPVTGLSSLAVTSTPQDVTATAAFTVNIGDKVTLIISASSSPLNLEFSLKATR